MKTVQNRVAELELKIDELHFDMSKAAVDYVVSAISLACLSLTSTQFTLSDLHKAFERQRKAELMLIEATSDVEVLELRNRAVVDQITAKATEAQNLIEEVSRLVQSLKDLRDEVNRSVRNASEGWLEFRQSFSETVSSEELDEDIKEHERQLSFMHEGHGDVIREFEKRRSQIDTMRARLSDVEHGLNDLNGQIKRVRDLWEPKLDKLVKRISDCFSYNMGHIQCAGEVSVHKDEDDFDAWAIAIRVKFREHEPLTQLDSHRQSGGERAVSTIFYLMSLQSLTRSPFRVVDEINQGMDPRNERLVHARMVSIATGHDDWRPQIDDLDVNDAADAAASARPVATAPGDDDAGDEDADDAAPPSDDDDDPDGEDKHMTVAPPGGSQYFLITPKLLDGLKYERGMRVLCIASGEYMPADRSQVDFRRAVEIRRGLTAVAG